MSLTLKLHELDNVAVVRCELLPGVLLSELGGIEVLDTVPRFHKIAIRDIEPGEPIRKYNQIIGVASNAIRAGQHVHVHNSGMPKSQPSQQAQSTSVTTPATASVAVTPTASFMGYRRPSGKAGTRNYIGIMTSVNCSATVAKKIERHFENGNFLADCPNVDGVVAFTHATGCGMGKGTGFDLLNRVYKGYVTHPNFAGVLMIGLGCEVMQLADFNGRENLQEDGLFRSLVIQEQGGTQKTVAAGIAIVEDMIRAADQLRREPIPASELVVGLQCGGSDALSGITANPSLGAAMDILVRQGGTAILSETPEIYGAEHLLLQRAKSPEVARALVDRIDWWLDYAGKNGVELNNNPSPGNKAGGLTTILEKSLGAQAKGGNTPLNGVYEYAEPINQRGLVLMDSPGYDPVSVTGQMASGANLICFTTGRGSAFGSKPAPCLKLATNTPLFESMSDDMDFNCGVVFDGAVSVAECGQQVFEKLLAIASGERSKSEVLEYGNYEFLPWQIGAVI